MRTAGWVLVSLLGIAGLFACGDDDGGSRSTAAEAGAAGNPGSDAGEDDEPPRDEGADKDEPDVDDPASDDPASDDGDDDNPASDDASPGVDMDGGITPDSPKPDAGDDGPGVSETDAAAESGADAGGNPAPNDEACPFDATDTSYLGNYGSGSRLEARYWSSEGMPSAFRGFYDTALGVYCSFEIATDGALRCLPLDPAGVYLHHYADNSCQQPVYEVPATCAPGDTLRRSSDECGAGEMVRLVDAPAGSVEYFLSSDGSCAEREPRDPDQQFLVPGQTVAPDEFVEGSILELPGQCQAGLRLIEAADGARGPLTLFDAKWDVGCKWEGSEADINCRPSKSPVAVPLDFYADPDCTEALPYFASWPYGACNPPELIRSVPGTDDYYTVGAPLTEDVYMSFGGSCAPATDQAFIEVLYPLEQAVAASDLALLSTSFEGTGQLQAAVMREGSVQLGVTPTTFLDSATGLSCSPLLFSDGVRRCVDAPISGGSDDWYNDAACTQPLRICPGDDDCTGLMRYDTGLAADSCLPETVVTGMWTYIQPATAYYWFDGQLCNPIEDPSTGDEWVVQAVDLSTLGVIEEAAAD